MVFIFPLEGWDSCVPVSFCFLFVSCVPLSLALTLVVSCLLGCFEVFVSLAFPHSVSPLYHSGDHGSSFCAFIGSPSGLNIGIQPELQSMLGSLLMFSRTTLSLNQLALTVAIYLWAFGVELHESGFGHFIQSCEYAFYFLRSLFLFVSGILIPSFQGHPLEAPLAEIYCSKISVVVWLGWTSLPSHLRKTISLRWQPQGDCLQPGGTSFRHLPALVCVENSQGTRSPCNCSPFEDHVFSSC